MAFLPLTTPGLAWIPNPGEFTSPFPSTFGDSAMAALGGYSAGRFAETGAQAWALGTQIALKQKAHWMGDLRTDWLSQMMSQDPESLAWKGIFSQIQMPNSTNPAEFEKVMVNNAFDVAGGIVSAVPVYGQIIAGVLDVAQYFYNLFRKEDPAERLPLVPMQEYSQGLDEDRVKAVVFPLMQGGDWTRMFWPNLRWQEGWRMLPGDEANDTWAWGTFPSSGGSPRYSSDAPSQDGEGGGLGFMPGTQKLADVIQMTRFGQYKGPTSRIDTIVPVGSFFPATGNLCTSLWEMVRKPGNPDMYKVRSGDLWVAWSRYFAAMRQSFLDQWNYLWSQGKTWDEPGSVVDLGKLMSPMVSRNINLEGINGRWMWPLMFQKDGAWQPDPNDGRPGCDREDYAYLNDPSSGWLSDPEYQAGAVWPPDRCAGSYNQTIRKSIYKDLSALVLPACEGLKQNQFTSIYRTEVCAYVRPIDTSAGRRYAAFEDQSVPWGGGAGTFGEQLTERCLHARDVLLTKDLRYKVRLEDVDAIDPDYAARLRQSGVTETSWQRPVTEIAAGPVGIGESEPPEPSPGPGGGTPFGLVEASVIRPGGGGGLLLGAAAVAAFAALRGR